jgi:hypothetical protein
MVVVKVDSAKVIATLKKAGDDLPKKIELALETVAALGTEIILDRTEEGRGYKGKFKPYSKFYAAAKRKGWKAGKGPFGDKEAFSGDPSGIVNLQLHKRMLTAMQSKAKGNQGQIYFSDPESARKAYKNNLVRPFFGFNAVEIKELTNQFERVLMK